MLVSGFRPSASGFEILRELHGGNVPGLLEEALELVPGAACIYVCMQVGK